MSKYTVSVTRMYNTGYDRGFSHYWDNALDAIKDFYDQIMSEKHLYEMGGFNEVDYVRVALNVKYNINESEEQIVNSMAYYIDEDEMWIA